MRKPVYAICELQRADQPAHPRCLISAFVVCCTDSIIPLIFISEISRHYLASEAEQAGNPEDRYPDRTSQESYLTWH